MMRGMRRFSVYGQAQARVLDPAVLEGYLTRCSVVVERIQRMTKPWDRLEAEAHHNKKEEFVWKASTMPEFIRDDFASLLRGYRLDNFWRGPVVTDDDTNNNLRSHERKYDSTLYLLLKSGDGKYPWHFVGGKWKPGEDLRQTAMRRIAQECGPHLNLYPTSFQPLNYQKIEFSEEEKEKQGYNGIKIFYLRAYLVNGHMDLRASKNSDFVWVPQEDLKDYLPASVLNTVTPILDH